VTRRPPLLLAWRAACLLPEPLVRGAAALAADVLWLAWRAAPPRPAGEGRLGGVRQYARTLAAVRPDVVGRARRRLVRDGLRSYARCWVDVFRVGTWDDDRRTRAFRPVGFEPMHEEIAAGRGVVVALSHSASWDVPGAWGSLHLGQVTTVAERLEPPEVFDAFVAARAAVGVEALPLTGGPPPMPTLVRRVRAGGVVPLLVDRDLGGAGVEVDLLGGRARVGGGAAALADVADARLFALESSYERDGGVPGGWVVVGRAHEVERVRTGPRAARVAATTQRVADLLGDAVRRHPEDWHVLQPVLLPPDAPAAGASS